MSRSADEQITQIYMFLLNKSFIPYFSMLEKWIYEGTIGIIFIMIIF